MTSLTVTYSLIHKICILWVNEFLGTLKFSQIQTRAPPPSGVTSSLLLSTFPFFEMGNTFGDARWLWQLIQHRANVLKLLLSSHDHERKYYYYYSFLFLFLFFLSRFHAQWEAQNSPRGASAHDPKFNTWAKNKNRMLHWLSHPDTLNIHIFTWGNWSLEY